MDLRGREFFEYLFKALDDLVESSGLPRKFYFWMQMMQHLSEDIKKQEETIHLHTIGPPLGRNQA